MDAKSVVLLQSTFRMWKCLKEKKIRTKMFTKRTNVANELLNTERDYGTNLKILIERFLRPTMRISNRKYLGPHLCQELGLCLSGVEMIYSFHCALYSELEEKVSSWGPASQIGALFLPMASYLKSYSTYINHYQNVVHILADRKGDKLLIKVLEAENPNSSGKNIKDYLIMPIQRIPRYQMLLQELVKSTWKSHLDRNNVTQSLRKVQAVAEDLENQSADASSVVKVVELSKILYRKEGLHLIAPHRRYIDEITCSVLLPGTQKSSTNVVILFNDSIIISKQPKKQKMIVQRVLILSEVSIDANESQLNLTVDGETVSLLINNDVCIHWQSNLQRIKAKERVWLPHCKKEENVISLNRQPASGKLLSPRVETRKKSKFIFRNRGSTISTQEETTKKLQDLEKTLPIIFESVMSDVKQVGGVTENSPWQARIPKAKTERQHLLRTRRSQSQPSTWSPPLSEDLDPNPSECLLRSPLKPRKVRKVRRAWQEQEQ